MGPADLRRQRDLRRLPGAGTEDRPALQGRREAELPARPRPGPKQVAAQFRAHVAKVTPPGVTVEVIEHHGAPAVLVGVDSPGVRAASRAIEAGFGTAPVFMREGGSIPVVGLLKENLGVDTLLLGWGQNDDNLHGPNEKFSLADYHRGIKASAHLLAELAKESLRVNCRIHRQEPKPMPISKVHGRTVAVDAPSRIHPHRSGRCRP